MANATPNPSPSSWLNSAKGLLEGPPYGVLIDGQIGLAVIKVLVTQDGMHRLHVAGRCQYAGGEGATATVRAAQLDAGLPVESADRLLERITGPI